MSRNFSLQNIYNFFSELELNRPYDVWYSKISPPRYHATIQYIASFLDRKKILELGSKPFLFSLLLKEYFPNNKYFFANFDSLKNDLVKIRNVKHNKTYTIKTNNFNAERDSFPYKNESLDMVIVMEILEHLTSDPMFMIKEINRILVKGGVLFLSAPNVLSWLQLYKLLNMLSPQESPSYTPGWMGNTKEYTPDEVKRLLTAGGFDIERLETVDIGYANLNDHKSIKDWSLNNSSALQRVREEMISLLKKLDKEAHLRGRTIFAIAKKVGPVRERYPAGIYTAEHIEY